MDNVKVNWKKFAIIFLIIVFVALTLLFGILKIVATVAAIVGSILAAIVFAFVLSVYKTDGTVPTSEEIKAKAEETIEKVQKKKMADYDALLQNFIRLNILIRYEGLKPSLAKDAESIIDTMREVIPYMLLNFSSEELTWELGKMAERHFPELIKRYVTLNENDRAGMESEFALNLATMKKELLEISDLISKNQQSEFSRKATEVQLKYA
jgi:hypothetical protein